MWSLEFSAETCPDGFDVVDRQMPDDERQRLVKKVGLLADIGLGRHLVPKSDRREPVKVHLDDLSQTVSVELINADDDEKLAAFFGRFGFLDDHTEIFCDTAEALRSQFTGLLTRKDPAEVNRLLARRRAVIIPQLSGDPLRLGLISADLVGHMLMEASAVVEVDADLVACQQCGARFLVGQYTGRRSTARFCDSACRGRSFRAGDGE
jgi:hypothetical protein